MKKKSSTNDSFVSPIHNRPKSNIYTYAALLLHSFQRGSKAYLRCRISTTRSFAVNGHSCQTLDQIPVVRHERIGTAQCDSSGAAQDRYLSFILTTRTNQLSR